MKVKNLIVYLILIFNLLFISIANSKITEKEIDQKEYCSKNTKVSTAEILIFNEIDEKIRKDSKLLIKYFCITNEEDKKIFTDEFLKNSTSNKKNEAVHLKFKNGIQLITPQEYNSLKSNHERKVASNLANNLKKNKDELTSKIVSLIKEKSELNDKFKELTQKFLVEVKNFKSTYNANIINLENFVAKLPNPAPKDYGVKKGFVTEFLNKKKNNNKQIEDYEKSIKKFEEDLKKIDFESLENNIKDSKTSNEIKKFESNLKNLEKDLNSLSIDKLTNEINKFKAFIKNLEEQVNTNLSYTIVEKKGLLEEFGIYFVYFLTFLFFILFVIFLIMYLSTLKKVGELKSFQERLLSQIDELKNTSSKQISDLATNIKSSRQGLSGQSREYSKSTSDVSFTNQEEEFLADYSQAMDNFDLVNIFIEKWKIKSFTRKERQDGSKTAIIPSQRTPDKAEIWVVDLSNMSLAMPGVTVKQNMSSYMNLDFEKAQRDFRGIFDISTGYSFKCRQFTELTRSGASYLINQKGKIEFPQ